MKDKIQNLLLSMPKQNGEYGESFTLIDFNVGSRRKIWDAEYNTSSHDGVFETKFLIDGKEVFVLVGEDYYMILEEE